MRGDALVHQGLERGGSMSDINEVREFWDKYNCGDVFTTLTERCSMEYLDEVHRNRYRYEYHLMPFLHRVANAGNKVLEIGCGIGMDAGELAKLGSQVVGVDLSPQSIGVAQRYFELKGLCGELRVANAEKLDFAEGEFDVVYSFGVLHHTPDINQALDEAYRVLRPGGLVFLMLYCRHSLNYFVHRLFHIPFESPRDWKIDAPITRTFSRQEVQQLMHRFVNLKVEKRYLFGAGWRPISDIVPQFLNDVFGRWLGWHWMIEAQKPE
jgi:ubiquinone/menaquinone biosynthesis C-methylase UbiE